MNFVIRKKLKSVQVKRKNNKINSNSSDDFSESIFEKIEIQTEITQKKILKEQSLKNITVGLQKFQLQRKLLFLNTFIYLILIIIGVFLKEEQTVNYSKNINETLEFSNNQLIFSEVILDDDTYRIKINNETYNEFKQSEIELTISDQNNQELSQFILNTDYEIVYEFEKEFVDGLDLEIIYVEIYDLTTRQLKKVVYDLDYLVITEDLGDYSEEKKSKKEKKLEVNYFDYIITNQENLRKYPAFYSYEVDSSLPLNQRHQNMVEVIQVVVDEVSHYQQGIEQIMTSEMLVNKLTVENLLKKVNELTVIKQYIFYEEITNELGKKYNSEIRLMENTLKDYISEEELSRKKNELGVVNYYLYLQVEVEKNDLDTKRNSQDDANIISSEIFESNDYIEIEVIDGI